MQVSADVIKAVTNLLEVLDEKTIIILCIIIAVFLIIRQIYDSKQKRYYFDEMKKEKNKEIERLADENRRYRDVYLRSIGLAPDDLRKASAIEATKTK